MGDRKNPEIKRVLGYLAEVSGSRANSPANTYA